MKFGRIELGKAPGVAGVIVDSIDMRKLKKAVREGADLVELRLDTLRKRDPASIVKTLGLFRSEGAVPLVLTVRSKAEGGRYTVKDPERLELFNALIPYVDGVDIELGSRKILPHVVKTAKRFKKRVIVSYHNFKKSPRPETLRTTVKRARRSGADIVKIAVRAKNRDELKRLAGLLLEGSDMIVIATGNYGTVSRVFFPILGSLITYGSVTRRSAPGQLPVRDIKTKLRALGF
jgi:3-dehydroquinate dehydratase-1